MEMREAPDPEPGPGEIRIRVKASGVNFADALARMGLYPDAPKPPLVVGYEVSGYVDAVGSGAGRHEKGRHVIALTRFGGYADTVVVPAEYVFAAPPNLSHNEAAAIPVNYLTASVALYKMANVKAGETVLIHGAGGGVGIAATQLARLRRAVIIGTASAAKHNALRSFGVDHALDYRTADVPGEVARLTGGRGVDVVLDPIGGAGLMRSYRMLAPLGRLVTYGVSDMVAGERRNWWRVLRSVWAMPKFGAIALMNDNRGVFGLNLGHLWAERKFLAGTMEALLADFGSKRLSATIARTFPLDRAADAHRFLQSRSNVGKVVLTD